MLSCLSSARARCGSGMPLALAARRAAAATGRRGLTAKAKGGSSEEMVALSRLSRAKATPYRVVLKLGNTNVKAAIIDDQRDLTVATASTLEPRVEALLAELFEQDRAKLQTLDAPALLDARLDGIAPDSALLQVPSSRHNHSSDRSAVGLIGTLLAHRAKEAGIDRVRMPVKRGGQGAVIWFRSVLRSHGLLIVEPKKADKWDNRVDKSHN